MRLKHFSKSSYQTFETCALRLHLHKNLGLAAEAGIPAKTGNEVHEITFKVLANELDLEQALAQATYPETPWLVQASLDALPEACGDQEFEVPIFLDENGCIVDEDQAILKAYLDRVIWPYDCDPAALIIDDLKTGRMETDSEIERLFYVGAARQYYWECESILFRRVFSRSRNVHSWLYRWGHNVVTVDHHDGTREEIHGATWNPLWEQIIERWNIIKASPPLPNPGPHCYKMYGQPCEFLGSLCPAYSSEITSMANQYSDGGAAFLTLCAPDVSPERLAHNTVAMAFETANRLSSLCKLVSDRAAEWSKHNGPISINGQRYGWKDKVTRICDKTHALTRMLEAGVAVSDIAKTVSMSASSLKRLPKKQFGTLGEDLARESITEVIDSQTFGTLGEVEHEIAE